MGTGEYAGLGSAGYPHTTEYIYTHTDAFTYTNILTYINILSVCVYINIYNRIPSELVI